MRQTLLEIPLNLTVSLFGHPVPIFGFGLLLGAWLGMCAWWTYQHYRKHGFDNDLVGQLVFQTILAFIIWQLPALTPSIKIYGYGMSMVCGFLVAAWLAGIRAQREGIEPAVMWDVGMVVLFSGVIGARLFFIAEHPADFFGGGRNLFQILFQFVNLPNGGLVLYGGVLLGIATYIFYCWKRKLSALKVADILIPSIFVGEMFGRIGCLLNGCCYGAPTALPWAIYFPPGSVPFQAELEAGLIAKDAVCTLPLHPTQIYSSLNAMVLAILTWNYFPHRSRNGSVLLLGWILYPMSRFCIEMVRNDTPPYVFFGIPLTIAQWVSIGMLIGAAAFAWFLSTRPKIEHPRPSSPPTPPVLASKTPAVAAR